MWKSKPVENANLLIKGRLKSVDMKKDDHSYEVSTSDSKSFKSSRYDEELL